MEIEICDDSGSGVSMINTDILKKMIVYRKGSLKDFQVQVANGNVNKKTEYALVEMAHGDHRELVAFVISKNLPCAALIGRATKRRLGITYDSELNQVFWRGDRLTTPEETYSDSVGATFLTKRISCFTIITDRREKIQAFHGKPITVRTREEGNPYTTAYFVPRNPLKNEVTPIQEGLVHWDRKNGTTLLNYVNFMGRQKTLPKGTILGQVHFLTVGEAMDMTIVPFGDETDSVTDRARKSREKVSKDLKNLKKENKKVPGDPTENDPVSFRVSENYREILEKHDLEFLIEGSEDNPTIQPTPLQSFLVEQVETQSYMRGFKDGAKNNPEDNVDLVVEESMVDVLINCLHTHVKAQNEPPTDPEMRKIYDIFKLRDADVTTEQAYLLAKLLGKYRSIWEHNNEAKINHTKAAQCEIIVEDGTRPIRQKSRQTSQAKAEVIWGFIENMEGRNVIRPSKSAWASPVLLAAKKNGKWRFCVDYRRLNDVTVKDAYPLPRIDEIISSLGGGGLKISTFDLTDAFWSIPMKEEDIEKTAFITKFGLWEFISMPFGLTNAPATQQRFIESILQGLLWKCCFAYIDDIVCFSRTFEQHLEDVESIFKRLEDNGLKLQPPKCSFLRPSFEILGYVATPDGLKPNPDKVKAMKEFPVLRTRKETQGFLGICSWLRRFIPKCSERTQHLRRCTHIPDPKQFKLTKEAIEEFHAVKEIICKDTCLAHPDMDKQFYIHVDASGVGIGAILTQLDDMNKHRVIEYASTVFKDGKHLERSNPQRESYGIIWALDHFKYYVLGRRPVVFCDCSCLMDIFNSKDANKSRIFNVWIARLLHYSPRLLHKPGKMMAIPDALSRSGHFVSYYEGNDDPVTNLLGKMVTSALKHVKDPDTAMSEQDNILDQYAETKSLEDEGLSTLRDQIPIVEQSLKTGSSQMGGCNLMETRSRRKKAGSAEVSTQNAAEEETMAPMSECVESESSTSCQTTEIDIELNEMAVRQRTDPVLSLIIEHLEFSDKYRSKRNINLSMKIIRAITQNYFIDDNGLLRINVVPVEASSNDSPVVLLSCLIDVVLKQYHDTKSGLGGHRTADKMLESLRRQYYFDRMVQAVHYYCRTCEACQIATKTKTPTTTLKPYFAKYPGIEVHIDCTPGPNSTKPTARGNSHIVAIVDSFTNYARLYPIATPSGAEIARVLLLYISVNSMPLKIVTDNGPEFMNELQTELAILLDLKRTHILPYNSKGNGKVEVAHKSYQRMLRAFIDDHVDDWDELLPTLEFAMNTTKNKGVGYSPFFLHFGREPIMPIDAYYEVAQAPEVTADELANTIERERRELFAWVADYREKEAKKRSFIYNEKHKTTETKFYIGDVVRIANEDRVGDHGEKYNPLYSHAIYRIIDASESGSRYTVRNVDNPNDVSDQNISRLKRIILRYELDIHPDRTHTSSVTEIDADEDKEKEAEAEDEEEDNRPVFEVDRLLGKRVHNGVTEYKVKWKGYPVKSKHNKWKK